MNKQEAKKRIDKLIDEINLHRYNYHVLDKESISEAALDSLKHELFNLEQEFPQYTRKDSPTQRVGGQAVSSFAKSIHLSPMLSLFDAFTESDMIAWQNRLGRFVSNKEESNFKPDWNYYCELKLDGLAVNLRYHKKDLVEGSTRGDGKVGENILSNLKTINSIPLSLDLKNIQDKNLIDFISSYTLEIRGEAIMSKSVFARLNEKYKKEDKALLLNTRNGAAGSLRQLNPSISAERKLDFYVYDIIFYQDKEKKIIVDTKQDLDILANALGFKTVKHNKKCLNLQAVFDFHQYWEKNKDKLDYDIDGVVVKVNDLKWWSRLGVVGKAPRYAMAFKFSAAQASTKLKDIVWQLGRTGILTPTAILEPVRLSGVTISRSTLHNMDEINRLGLKINDTVIIERAGDVIPKIVSVLDKLRDGSEQNINKPDKCPICQGDVVKIEDEVAYRCINKKCYAVNLRKIIHFASKKAMDIDSLGPKIIEQLLTSLLIKDFVDLYFIKKDDLLSLSRFAEKSADNLIRAIDKSREISLNRFIYALGIRHIGEESAYALSLYINESFPNLEYIGIEDFIRIMQSFSLDDFVDLDDFGSVVAQSVYSYFHDEENITPLNKLKEVSMKLILNKNLSTSGQELLLKSKKFLITGSLKHLTREAAKAKIKEMGGKIMSSVSSNLDYLIVGDKPGSKLDKAKQLDIKILTEDEFFKLINYKHE